jgi:hypothetical protein
MTVCEVDFQRTPGASASDGADARRINEAVVKRRPIRKMDMIAP